ncbi:MAG: 3-oxoacyl-[acyl-carrier-protein] synthase II [Candidatus Omnitrophota bacterium]|jgi:3-oxoacyl-[acyl-carrier-protein] synthase II
MSKRRVVITGIGSVSPCGVGIDALWGSIAHNNSGISTPQEGDVSSLPLHAAGYVRDFKPREYVKNRKSLKVMCRDIQMAVAASSMARADANLGEDAIDANRSGVCIGAGLFEHDPEEMADSFKAAWSEKNPFDNVQFGAEGMGQLFPLWLLKYLPNMPACHITINHNLRGPSNTLTADSSGSAAAIEESFRIIQRGTADLMFCGGAESRLLSSGLLRLHSMGLLKKGSPGDIDYSVFSEDASGLVFGEGGTILILEELEAAQKRNAKIYAEIKSVFASGDYNPDADAATGSENKAYAMKSVIGKAGLDADAIGSLHLSARGILNEDQSEANAIEEVFGSVNTKPSLVSTKTITSFMGYAAAPTELAIAAKALHLKKVVPANIGPKPLLQNGYVYADKGVDLSSEANVMVNHFESNLSNHSFVLASVGDLS